MLWHSGISSILKDHYCPILKNNDFVIILRFLLRFCIYFKTTWTISLFYGNSYLQFWRLLFFITHVEIFNLNFCCVLLSRLQPKVNFYWTTGTVCTVAECKYFLCKSPLKFRLAGRFFKSIKGFCFSSCDCSKWDVFFLQGYIQWRFMLTNNHFVERCNIYNQLLLLGCESSIFHERGWWRPFCEVFISFIPL